MNLHSMTGYARTQGIAQGLENDCSWVWELKSVNGKGLDVRCRLAGGFECLEQQAIKRIKSRFKRGNITASLTIDWGQSQCGVQINHAVLKQFMAILPTLRQSLADAPAPTIEGMLALRGVIETTDGGQTEEVCRELDHAFLAGLDEAVESLHSMRADEGARLGVVLTAQIDEIGQLADKISQLAAMQPAAIKARLKIQIEELLDELPSLPEERLAQEAAMIIMKSDIREELDRLKAHVVAARALMDENGAIGRKFDFLCQEFGREANTLCSKSADAQMSRLGLEMKVVIDQLREQVQNIE